MLGLSDKGWLIELIHGRAASTAAEQLSSRGAYDAYFGLGRTVTLMDDPRVFKVSPAGLALGAYLGTQVNDAVEIDGPCLDMGTGSGVLAILLRSLGAEDVTASDICSHAVGLAAQNEQLNFNNHRINFVVSNLFSNLLGHKKFDTVIFNPPGWRAPSERMQRALEQYANSGEMPLSGMFYGDSVLLEFLAALPDHLHARGRAVVGMNSLVGIQDVLRRYRSTCGGRAPLKFRLIERHTFPLILYTEAWQQTQSLLREEFKSWRKSAGSAFTVDSAGQLYWSYELVECQFATRGR